MRIKEILDSNRFDSYNKLMEALNGYLKCYNHFNKQKALGYKNLAFGKNLVSFGNKTPVDMIKYWYKTKREIFKEDVDISLYNLSPPDIRTIEVGQKKKGSYTQKDRVIFWDLRNDNQQKVSKGLYFYKLQAGDFNKSNLWW